MWRAGISDKDLICQSAMEVFIMVTVFDSPHKRSVLMRVCMCVCCLVIDNENAESVLLKTTQPK